VGQTWDKLPLFDPVCVDLGELQGVGLARVDELSVVRPKRALHDAGLLGQPSQVHTSGERDRDVGVSLVAYRSRSLMPSARYAAQKIL
jgi:hypothetical protein